ncbi:hypothetical protein MMC29_000815 [Sticta canariensis]|nr:hypothetical protein [Sticta canariensis]
MEAVAAAASIVGVLEISLKVLSLTVEYSTQVKSAKEDISRFRLELEAFIQVVRSLHELSQNPEASKLVTFNSIARSGSIQQCELDLKNLQTKLKPSKGERAMSRYGVRALKWPFESKELHNLLVALERYKSTFSTALNADQSYLILESGVKLDLAEQDRCLSKLSYAVGSNFDSNERENEPYCLPDTRVEILSQILEWSADPGHKSIFWLNGMAGTGKSTIARTIARTLTEQKRLAANFFFSRGRGDLSHAGKLLSTIAVQLAATSPTLKRYICEAISENSDVIRQSMRDQWTQLIYKPLSRLEGGSQSPLIIVFVFDALDECGPQDDVRKLIQLLAETKHLVAVQFRALVTSRPEIPIQLGFRAISGKLHEDFVLHNIAPPVVQHDIEIFLRHEINVMRDEHLLPSDWPSKEKFDLLVERCSGLFIYAATAR